MWLQQPLAPAWIPYDGTITFSEKIAVTRSIFRRQVTNRRRLSITLATQQSEALRVVLVAQAELPPQLPCIRQNSRSVVECRHAKQNTTDASGIVKRKTLFRLGGGYGSNQLNKSSHNAKN